jgi:hypothetical protein
MTTTNNKGVEWTATLTMALIDCAQASGLSDEDQLEAHIAATDACLGDLQLRVAMIDKVVRQWFRQLPAEQQDKLFGAWCGEEAIRHRVFDYVRTSDYLDYLDDLHYLTEIQEARRLARAEGAAEEPEDEFPF